LVTIGVVYFWFKHKKILKNILKKKK
jgi:hypothetical protein